MIKGIHLYFHAWAIVAWVHPGPFPSLMLMGLLFVAVADTYKKAGK